MTVDRSALPVVGPDVSVRFPPVDRVVLSNGLGVWTVRRPDVPVLTLLLVIPTGSAADPPLRPGLSALTADMLDEGSGTRDAIAMHQELARLGAQLDIESGYDATLITLVVLARFRREALSLLADMTFRPRLDPSDFSRVRELRCNRLAQLRDVPSALAEQAFTAHVFGAHPYGHLPIGTESSLRAVELEEVRAFHASRYAMRGALLIAVGDIEASLLEADGEQAFGQGADGAIDFVDVPPSPIHEAGRRLLLLHRPGAPQSELRVGHIAVARSTPDYHALVVLNAVLGGQFVSRINVNLREEKGLTYGARSGFDWRRAPGPFVVQTSVQTDGTATAVAEILRELREVASDRPPTARELDLARASLTRGYARSFETAEQVARALAQLAVYELPADWFDRFVPCVRDVRAEDVVDAARRHLHPDRALVTVVGDTTQVEHGLLALGFAGVDRVEP
jgi:predicted Zn-dependent peptidase